MSPANGEGYRVGIGGFGAIGMNVARALDAGIPGLTLAAVSANNREAAAGRMDGFETRVPVVGLGDLAAEADIVVECAPAAVFREVAVPAVEAGRIFMPLSCGQMLDNMDLVERAEETGGRIVIPTGALLGLDSVRAAAEGTIESVTMVTRKPPTGLAGAPHLVRNNISLDGLREPKVVFEGSALDALRGFPENVNVCAGLSLAGIGPEKTRIRVIADPGIERNMHTYEVEGEAGRMTVQIENIPTENPKTGRLTAMAIIAGLKEIADSLHVGT